MPTYFFFKNDFLWYGEADNSDAAYRLCLREMDWHMDDPVKFAGVDLSEEAFGRFRFCAVFPSPCDLSNPKSKRFEMGFTTKENKFITLKEAQKLSGVYPPDDLPDYPPPKKAL